MNLSDLQLCKDFLGKLEVEATKILKINNFIKIKNFLYFKDAIEKMKR